jgi:N-acetylmuramoyl-L-alanine amidase
VYANSSVDSVPQSPPIVAVFAGHTESLQWHGNHQGIKSASGIPEHRYNDTVAALFAKRSSRDIRYMVFPAGLNIPYQSRAEVAAIIGARALVEIHHDGVQPDIYSRLLQVRKTDPMLSFYRGFSLHVFPRAPSLTLARDIEDALLAANFSASTYHQEDVSGERMKLVPGTKATYDRQGLALLNSSNIPAVIVECGCIANPAEDKLLKDPAYQNRIVDTVHRGVQRFIEHNGR